MGRTRDGFVAVGGSRNAPTGIGRLGSGRRRANGHWYLGWRKVVVGQQLATGAADTLAGNSTASFISITIVMTEPR